jgi:uncharacterized protein (TIGR03382 family)
MKTPPFVVLLLSVTALADYAPPAVKCVVPPECVTCSSERTGPPLSDCLGAAEDAGLVVSDCFDFTGITSGLQTTTKYACPPGVKAYRGHACGCTSAEAVAAMALAMAPLVRRRKKR